MRNVAASRLTRLLPLVILLAVSACDCVGKRLVIVDPEPNTSFGSADDLDVVRGGLQRDVVVDAIGLGVGAQVSVVVTPAGEDTEAEAQTFAGFVQPNGRATVRVTLPQGESALVACVGESCSHPSPAVVVGVQTSVGVCPLVQFVSPRVGGTGTVVLDAQADRALDDGTCGAVYATAVRARVEVEDGTRVTLFVDGLPTRSVEVAERVADFGDVVLGVRGESTSRFHLGIDGFDGRCAEPFADAVRVDCPGSSCSLVPPEPLTGRYLGVAHDADPGTPGLEVAFSATSAVDAVGRAFTLVDGETEAELTTALAGSGAGQSRADFPPQPFADGPIAVAASCTDGVRTTRSATAVFEVDTVPCGIAIDAPTAGTVFVAADDLDGDPTNGVQTSARATTSGDACAAFRIAACQLLPATEFVPLLGSGGTSVLSLGTSGGVEVCAQVRDVAGNLGEARVKVGVAPGGAPQLAITSPAEGALVNRLGGGYAGQVYLADRLPGSAACDVAVVVDCSGLGAPVGLTLDGAPAPSTATCVADADSTLGGRATFANVTLPTSRVAHTLQARQTTSAGGGASMPFALLADCAAPVLSISSPACGSYVGPEDDVSSAPGLQVSVTVASPNVPQVDVALQLTTSAGMTTALASPAAFLPPGATSHTFSAVDLGGAGVVTLVPAGADAFGNVATGPACPVTLTGLPSIVLDALPVTTFDATNSASFDCAPGGGLDLRIAGSTSASNGSEVGIAIGVGATVRTTVASGRFSACVPAPAGRSEILATVVDAAFADGIAGTARAVPIVVEVRRDAPLDPITPVTATIVDRRAAVAELAFTAVSDAVGGRLARYEVRCAPDGIATEASWGAAAPFVVDPRTPAVPGATDRVTVRGFSTGTSARCVVRGVDAAGNRTPIPPAGSEAVVAPSYRVATFDGPTANGAMGITGARAVGDVDGDGRVDFVVSGAGVAYLYRGAPAGQPPTLATRFTKQQPSSYFGTVVRGIGDFDRDGRADLAIADPSAPADAFDGEVYVLYGRANWPATINLSEAGCQADFCVRARPGSQASLGWDAASLGDFDGLPGPDLALAAPTGGRVYVLSARAGIPNRATFVLGTNDPVGYAVVSPSSLGNFGWTLGAPGNVAGSALADLVVGETGDWPPGNSSPSRLFRVDGRALPSATTGLVDIAGAAQLVRLAADATLPSSFGTFDLLGIAAGDFDADGARDLFAFSIGSATVGVGAYVLYGGATATYPFAGATRVHATASAIATSAFGVGRGFAYDPNFGRVGDVNRDGADELFAGAITATADGRYSVALVYGRGARPGASLAIEADRLRSAVLAPAVEALPRFSPYPLWLGSFVGDVVTDTPTSYPDLVVSDPGTFDPTFPQGPGRIFVLY